MSAPPLCKCHSKSGLRQLISSRYSSIRNPHGRNVQEIKKGASQEEVEITNAIAITSAELSTLTLADYGESDTPGLGEAADEEASVREASQDCIEALEASIKILKELLSKTGDKALAKAVGTNTAGATNITFGDRNSGFQIGRNDGSISGVRFGQGN